MVRLVSPIKSADWIIYVAVLPALLSLVCIGVTAAMGWDTQALRNTAPPSAIPVDDDHYAEGLAKLGIVQLPGHERPAAPPNYEPPPDVDLVSFLGPL